MSNIDPQLDLFKRLVHENRYDLCKLVYILFPFGEKDHPLEFEKPYSWQMKEWAKLSAWLQNPLTRYQTYKLVISTGNGSGKTAFGAMTMLMLMYTNLLRGRLTANTKPQLTQVLWPQYDKWFRFARYSDTFFEKFGESIKSRDDAKGDQWQFSLFTWDEANPAAVSGLHNKGNAILYTFEEAPGIPANIFQYANGAFAVVDTIKVWMVFGNSDDPDSKFEKLMSDPDWNALRIDTRTLDIVDKAFIASVLKDCGGDEDADDFRVRVRGLPRKTNADSIINRDRVRDAFERAEDFDIGLVNRLPAIITVDPAWTGGDFTTIWFHQGHYSKLLNAYRLDSRLGEDHKVTYDLLVEYEKRYHADAVWIDRGEGTALKTLANADGRYHWDLVDFGSAPNDNPNRAESEYANMRAQLYFEGRRYFNEGSAVLEISDEIRFEGLRINNKEIKSAEELKEAIIGQFGYTKGDRHKITMKKICESKKEIKARVGESPDFADGFLIRFYRLLLDRMPEHEVPEHGDRFFGEKARDMYKNTTGSRAIDMPSGVPDYSMEMYRDIYR